jgi:hypothetical protein
MTDQITFDRRFRSVRETYDDAYRQMKAYWLSRYSWGQPCDPKRAEDWATLAAHIMTVRVKEHRMPDLNVRYQFPSGNVGTISSLIDHYHDGWGLLEDLELVDECIEHA